MPQPAYNARALARAVFHYGGGTWLTRRAHRQSLRILMYHRFQDISAWEMQCRHLRTRYEPISLTEAAAGLSGLKSLPPNAVVLTIDDGYRDSYTRAFPTLRKYSIPAIVYLATDLLDRGDWLWTDRVTWMHEHSPRLTALSPGARRLAASQKKQMLKTLPNGERVRAVSALSTELEVDVPSAPPDRYAPLSWDEVREMTRHGIEFGAHTQSHPILSRLPGRQETAAEIIGSKQRIEQELGWEVRHFCYPNGMTEDFTAETVEVVREGGFATAVTAQSGINPAGADPFRLRRISQDPHYPETMFGPKVAGFRL